MFKLRHNKTNLSQPRGLTALASVPARDAPARRPRPPPTEVTPSLGIRAPDAPRVYPAHVSPSPSRCTRAPRTRRTASPSRARRKCVDRGAAVPRRHLGCHHRVTGEHQFKVAPPPPSRVPCRAGAITAPPSMEAAFHSHPITRAPPLGLLGAHSIACCPNRVLPSPKSRSPRPSPPATDVRLRLVSFRPNSGHK
jgi:hypothetical protein